MGRHKEVFAQPDERTYIGPDCQGDMLYKDDFVSIVKGNGEGGEGWVRFREQGKVHVELTSGKVAVNLAHNLLLKEHAAKVMLG